MRLAAFSRAWRGSRNGTVFQYYLRKRLNETTPALEMRANCRFKSKGASVMRQDALRTALRSIRGSLAQISAFYAINGSLNLRNYYKN